tara:strand:- start:1407 stop:2363 length:957 start_codon:yes stop_codon:yes gene_type:complete
MSGATGSASAVKVSHQPGTQYVYSNGGYVLLQLIIEEVTGLPFATYMQREVLIPLSMTDSSYNWDDHVDRIAATPYVGGIPVPKLRFRASATAGLQTTLDDLTRFALANMVSGVSDANGILRIDTIKLMHRATAPSNSYGLGFVVSQRNGVRYVLHQGQNRGWLAQFTLAPETGDGIILMTNDKGSGALVVSAIMCEWVALGLDQVCEENLGQTELPIRLAESLLVRTEGRYQMSNGSVFEFRVIDGRLLLFNNASDFRLGNSQVEVYARSPTEFFLPPLSFKLEIDEEGTVESMLVRMNMNPWEKTQKLADPVSDAD